MLGFHEEPPLALLARFDNLRRREENPTRDPVFETQAIDLPFRPVLGPCEEMPVGLRALGRPPFLVLELGVRGPFGIPDHLDQRVPVMVRDVKQDLNVAVFAGDASPVGDVPCRPGFHEPGLSPQPDRYAGERGMGLLLRHIDMLAAPTGLPAEHADDCGHCCCHSAVIVPYVPTRLERLPAREQTVGEPGRHQPTFAPGMNRVQVVGLPMSVGPGLAERRDGEQDQGRVDPLQLSVAQAE